MLESNYEAQDELMGLRRRCVDDRSHSSAFRLLFPQCCPVPNPFLRRHSEGPEDG